MTEAAAGRPRVLSLVEIDAGELKRLEAVADVEGTTLDGDAGASRSRRAGRGANRQRRTRTIRRGRLRDGRDLQGGAGSQVHWNLPRGYGSRGHRRRYRRRCGGDAYARSQCRGRGGVDDRDDAGAVAGYPGNVRVRPGATLAGSGNRLLRDAGLGVGSTSGGDRWPGAHRSPDREVGQRFWGTSVGHGPGAERRAGPGGRMRAGFVSGTCLRSFHDVSRALPVAGVHEGPDRRVCACPDAEWRSAGGDHGRGRGAGRRCGRGVARRTAGGRGVRRLRYASNPSRQPVAGRAERVAAAAHWGCNGRDGAALLGDGGGRLSLRFWMARGRNGS